MLVTIERYRAITGDRANQDVAVTAAIEQAEEELADDLGRPLAEGAYSEYMVPTRDGMLWPKATPIVTAEGYSIVDGVGLCRSYGVWSSGPATIAYTGGWVERTANPTAPNRLPTCIEEDLAWRARAIVCPDADGIDLSEIPAGATSVRLGDAAVGFGGSGAPARARSEAGPPRWSRRTLAYRHRVVRGV